MSFSQETKENVSQIFVKKGCCALSLLWGILRFAGIFDPQMIRLKTHSRAVMELTLELLQRDFGIAGEVYVRAAGMNGEARKKQGSTARDGAAYRLTLSAEETALIRSAYHFGERDRGIGDTERLFRCDKCASAFVRGAFLSAGSISDPAHAYHLDLAMPDGQSAAAMAAFLAQAGLAPKRTVRKQIPILYYKGSEAIEDFLAYIGATKSAFTMMDAKIMKEIRNDTNRKLNFDMANLSKTITGAQAHINAIIQLQQSGRLALLPLPIRTTAALRLDNPELSLAALAAMHEPRLTKSGLNHRLQKILEAAQEIEKH